LIDFTTSLTEASLSADAVAEFGSAGDAFSGSSGALDFSLVASAAGAFLPSSAILSISVLATIFPSAASPPSEI